MRYQGVQQPGKLREFCVGNWVVTLVMTFPASFLVALSCSEINIRGQDALLGAEFTIGERSLVLESGV